MHWPELALISGTLCRRGRNRRVGMDAQREVFDDPPHLSRVDKALVELWLRRQRMTLAGGTLEIAELDHHELGVWVALVAVPGDGESGALGIGRQTLGLCPERHFELRGGS